MSAASKAELIARIEDAVAPLAEVGQPSPLALLMAIGAISEILKDVVNHIGSD